MDLEQHTYHQTLTGTNTLGNMRILYLHQYFTTPERGGGTRSYEIAKALVERGHQVTVVASYSAGEPLPPDSYFNGALRIKWMRLTSADKRSTTRRLMNYSSFALRSLWPVINSKVDCIYATSTPLTIGLPALVRNALFSTPFVFEVRDSWPLVPVQLGLLTNPWAIRVAEFLEATLYRRSEFVVALSPGIANRVTDVSKRDSGIVMVSNLPSLPEPTHDDVLLADSILRHKGISGPFGLYTGDIGLTHCVEFLAQLSHSLMLKGVSFPILVVGRGSHTKSLESEARISGVLDQSFFMHHFVPKGVVAALTDRATVIFSTVIDHPALEDNSANKFFDALGAGRPIMINYGGWQADVLAASGAGLRLSRDVDDAATTLVELLAQPDRLLAMAEASRVLGETRFSKADLVGQLIHLVESTSFDRRS